MKFVYATYPDGERANHALAALADAHVPHSALSVLVRDGRRIARVPVKHGTRSGRDAAIGGVAGVVIGLVLAAAGVGGIFSESPMGAAIEVALVGAMVGILAGAVRGLGWWHTEAEFPARGVDAGGVLVGASVLPAHVPTIKAALEDTGGRELNVTEEAPEIEARHHFPSIQATGA